MKKFIERLNLALRYGPELDTILKKERNEKANAKRKLEQSRLQLCGAHQQERNHSHYASHNCDFCKVLHGHSPHEGVVTKDGINDYWLGITNRDSGVFRTHVPGEFPRAEEEIKRSSQPLFNKVEIKRNSQPLFNKLVAEYKKAKGQSFFYGVNIEYLSRDELLAVIYKLSKERERS